jgi:hypothetical protein
LDSDYIANVQVERAESARLALELQQARQINVQPANLQHQQIEQAGQQSNVLLQVLSRGYLDDIIAYCFFLALALSASLSRAHDLSFSSVLALCSRALSRSLVRASLFKNIFLNQLNWQYPG